MATDQLKERLAARPFLPFTIRHADGKETRVAHPEAMAYRGGRVAAYVHADYRVEIIDLLLVSSLLVDAPNGGGARKRRSKESELHVAARLNPVAQGDQGLSRIKLRSGAGGERASIGALEFRERTS